MASSATLPEASTPASYRARWAFPSRWWPTQAVASVDGRTVAAPHRELAPARFPLLRNWFWPSTPTPTRDAEGAAQPGDEEEREPVEGGCRRCPLAQRPSRWPPRRHPACSATDALRGTETRTRVVANVGQSGESGQGHRHTQATDGTRRPVADPAVDVASNLVSGWLPHVGCGDRELHEPEALQDGAALRPGVDVDVAKAALPGDLRP